ncbi:MAG: FAD-binding oxidoreductase [Chromatiales bacterium]|nr:MAG: FAD-binding oxidoreductase [Chromatiales bacterium]
MSDVVQVLTDELGAAAIVSAERLRERATSYWNAAPTEAKCLVRPGSTAELASIMRICHAHGQTVVAQGGKTGIVEGAVSTAADVIVSLERMNELESVDTSDGVAVIQAGAVLQTVQEHVAGEGFLFPVDFGARGSCTIGGAVATNAGGINVLRYGMMRNVVLGLEAVLADGTVISSMNQMLKNNTGYDLKQLFIGSEGTLGIVTRVVVRLFPMPVSRDTVMFACESFAAVTRQLGLLKVGLAGTLSAFEVMWESFYSSVTAAGGPPAPLERGYPYYVIAEAEGADPGADAERFQRLLEEGMESGDIVDAVLPKSEAERRSVWNVREEFDGALPAYLYDVSLPIRNMETYVARLGERLLAWREDASCEVFGHIADGNLHIFVKPYDDGGHHETSDGIVYGCLDGLDGSISAEHGIGIDKRPWLGLSRSADELNLMRELKRLLDPQNLLNPGKVIN